MNTPFLRHIALGFALGVSCFFQSALGAEEPPLSAYSRSRKVDLLITEENDFFAGTDRHYTQGAKITLLLEEDWLPGCTKMINDWIPALGLEVEQQRLGVAVAQRIYTPRNMESEDLISKDRPYAGVAYLGGIWQREGRSRGEFPTLDSLELDLGVIGPWSLAKETQEPFHRTKFVRGWRNQKKNEPALVLKGDRQWLLRRETGERCALDFIPHLGAGLGNIATHAEAGVWLRWGFNPGAIAAPIDGPAFWPMEHKNSFSYSVFVGADGRAVAYNGTLDESLFRDGPSVDTKPLVADFKGGMAIGWKRFEGTFTWVLRSREFSSQSSEDVFSSIAVRLHF